MINRTAPANPHGGRGLVRKATTVARRAAKGLRLRRHRGDRYLCPFCGYRSEDLAAIGFDFPVLEERQVVGAGIRRGGCHSCGSTDRDRLVYLYLTEFAGLPASSEDVRVLHVAPEACLSGALAAMGLREYVRGDKFAEDYEYDDDVRELDVLDLDFESDTFDFVICNHVLEHIADDRAAMSEILRVLKPGGRAVLQVPMSLNGPTIEDPSVTDPKARELRFGQHDHVRIYGRDYLQRLRSVGFEVTEHALFGEYAHYGIAPDEVVVVGAKVP